MLVNKDEACLILFNMQLELIPLLHNSYQLVHDSRWLVDLFTTHHLPIVLTAHKKLGNLIATIQDIALNAKVFEKQHFSIHGEPCILDYLSSLNKKQLIFAGAESHICMLQSAFNLRSLGYEVFFISDVMSARSSVDNEAAKSRLSDQNYQFITKEMLFFELIEHSELSYYLDLSLKFLDGRYIKHAGISTCLQKIVQTD
jgi:nicotinamidase-related amidase